MKQLLTVLFSTFIISLAYAQPITDFSASPLEICVGEEVQFTDLSTSSETINGWTWDFGDGSTSADQNPTHTYTNSGDFTVTLTANDVNGAEPEVKINYIKVNPLPTPSFTTNLIGGCTLPSQVQLTNISPSSGVTYNWDFGNGTNSTSSTPGNVTYNTASSYDIVLTVTDNTTACENTFTQTVDIVDYQAEFSASSATTCQGGTVAFTDNSSLGTDAWNWSFGDGSSSSAQNPSHTFATPGTYTVTLTATNTANNCTNTYTETIEVFPLPTPTFTFDTESGCAPLDVNFTNTSTGGGTYEWDFGDGNTFSGETPPANTYTSNGSFTVTLTQTDANGCINSVQETISVSPIEADFSADVLEGCEALDVVFTDLSSSPNTNDPITSWNWDFGNGSTFNGQNPPTQSYNEGVYDVTLTINTTAGCNLTVTFDEYISVGIPPNVDFSWNPIQDCAKSEWEFTNLTTIPVPHDPSEVTYNWEFGDGGTDSQENPTYEYPQDTGYFDVQLIVDFRGCPDTMIYENAVYVDAPIALFSVTSVYCNPTLPLEVTFNDNAIIGKETDNAEMIWDWGDGTTSTIVPPDLYNDNPGDIKHTYNNLGSYDIKQVVHNYTTGCSDSITNTIHLSDIEAFFDISNDSVCVNNQITLSNNGSTSTHPLSNYSYDFGDGSVISGENINYTYSTPGTYDITFTVTNNVGCSASRQFLGFEALALPQANITASDNFGCAPLTVTFTNSSVSQSGVPLTSFDWTFTDGSTQSTATIGQTTNFTFTSEGTFQTRLVATDEFGCVSPTTLVQTTLTKPTALFDLPAVVCSDEVFSTTNNSINYVSSEWFVNTSSESTDTDLTTSLNHVGSTNNYSSTDNIILIVTDANGCKDTLEQSIITSTPYADFGYTFSGANTNSSGNFVCPPVFASLEDLSGSYGNITNWNWNFGDGKSSTLQNPNNTYVFAGSYTGSLVIVDEYGCSDTMVNVDYLVIDGPKGDLEWTLKDYCENEYTFTPSNLDGVSNILWIMGNGDTISSIDEFDYIYDDAGTFTPTAILVNVNNCNVPYTLNPITITQSLLDPYFEVDPLEMNWGELATISDFSTGGYGGIVDWSWETGEDQFNNSGGSFGYMFNSSGDVVVTLTVTDTAGCKASYEVIVKVNAVLTIPNILTANGDGTNDIFKIIDNVYKSYTVTILNRWGNVVSERYIEEGNYLWDGYNRWGDEATDGVYFYKIDGLQRDGKPRVEHGFVHLVR